MTLFSSLPKKKKDKIYFIHFIHTNSLLNLNSKQRKDMPLKGFKAADQGLVIGL
jgi:hypothetical protein